MNDERSQFGDQAFNSAAICGQCQTASLERVRRGVRHISADAVATAKPTAFVPRAPQPVRAEVDTRGRGLCVLPERTRSAGSSLSWHAMERRPNVNMRLVRPGRSADSLDSGSGSELATNISDNGGREIDWRTRVGLTME